MYQLKGKPVTQRVTKKLAAEFAEMDPTPRDRPLSERRLSVYRSLWSKGLFRPCTWARRRPGEAVSRAGQGPRRVPRVRPLAVRPFLASFG
jgi:hypothetical protein